MLIEKLELVLENCEVITIDGKYVGDFHAGDIRKELTRMACNHIDIMEICHLFCLEVHKDANIEYFTFGNEEWKTTIFDRLNKNKDITAIYVHLYDQYDDSVERKVEHYYISWHDEDEYDNRYQNSKISKNGWLYIVVGKDADLNEVFKDDDIDDSDFVDFHESMLEIGDKCCEENNVIKTEIKKTDS